MAILRVEADQGTDKELLDFATLQTHRFVTRFCLQSAEDSQSHDLQSPQPTRSSEIVQNRLGSSSLCEVVLNVRIFRS